MGPLAYASKAWVRSIRSNLGIVGPGSRNRLAILVSSVTKSPRFATSEFPTLSGR
jgi:hypothetical protein